MKQKFLVWLLAAMAILLPVTAKAQCDNGTPVTVTISGVDSYGDGWEGSLTIYRNNVQMSTFTVDEDEDELVLTVCQGDSIRVEWSGSDQYNENTFSIYNCTDAVVTDAQGSSYAPSGVVASFEANCPSCMPVTDLTATNVTESGLTLSWTDNSNSGASYTITYVDAEGTTQTLTSTTTSIDVTGLTALTAYTFSVVANCSATDASAALTGTFTSGAPACAGTTCNITLQMVDSYGDGWNGGYIGLYQGDAEMGTWTVSGSSNDVSVEVCGTAAYKLRLVNRGSYPGEMGVTVLDGAGVEVFSVSGMNGYQNDDLLTLITSPCPSCMRPDSISLSDATTDGVTLNWVAGGSESQWVIYLNDSLVAEVSSPSYTFTDLESNTGYTAGIRAYCGGTDTSSARTVSFRTACEGSTCDLTLQLGSSSSWSSPWSYGATVELTQNGSSLGTYGSTTTVEVCGTAPITVSYNGASYSYYDSYATIVVKNGGGVEVYNGGNSGLPVTISEVCPSCLPPTALYVDDVEQDAVTLHWTARSDASLFAVYQGDSLVNDAVTDTFYTFGDLESNTAYTFRVQAICSSEDSSALASLGTRTACGEISLPYTVDFEDAAYNGAWYPCWDSVLHYNTDPSVNNVRNHTTGGTYSMYLQGENMVASPSVPLPGNSIMVSFWAYLYNSGSTIEAGVMTDLSDTSTFVPLLTITGVSTGWNEYDFNTSTLDPTATYYVVWHSYGANSQIGAFDDVTISEFTGCARPETATIGEVGPYTAEVSWSSVEDASDYTVYYSTVNNPADPDINFDMVYGDTTITLQNLAPQTTYYVWVATRCGSAESDLRPAGYFTTQTTCAPVENVTLDNITYVAAQISWSYNTTVGFPSSGITIDVYDNADNSQPVNSYSDVPGTSLLISGLTSGHSYTAVLRNACTTTVSVDSANAVSFTFMTSSCSEISGGSQTNSYVPTYSYYGNSYTQMMYNAADLTAIDTIRGIAFNIVNSVSDTRTFDVYMGTVDTTAFNGNNYFPVSGMTLVASNYSYALGTAGWTTVDFDSNFVYTGGNLVVTVNDKTNSYSTAASFAAHPGASLYSYRDNTSYTPSDMTTADYTSTTVPDIRFVADCEAPTCYAPMLTVMEADSNNITLTWPAIGTESSYVVLTSLYGDSVMTNQGTQGDRTFYFTSLTPSTTYLIQVGSICGTDTLWSEVVVRTACGAMQVPYMETFEGQIEGASPACWTSLDGTPAIGTNGHNSDRAVHFGGNQTVYMVSDSVPLPGDSISVSFWANNYYASVDAGVMSDPADASTFVSLISANQNGYNFYEYNTTTLSPDTTYYVAFRYNGGYSYYYTDIDDILIRRDDGCRRPTTISLDSVDVTYAELSWSDNGGNSTEYVVMYSNNGGNTWSTASTTTTDVVLNSLSGASNYVVRVGAVCSADTLWSNDFTFATGCPPYALPYFEDFDSYAVDVLPPCWNFNTPASVTHWDGGLFFRSYGGANNYAVLPPMQAPLSKVQMTFITKVGTPAENDGILIGAADNNGVLVEWLDTIQRSDFSRNDHKLVTYDFLDYEGAGTRIALAQLRSWSQWALVDSITVIEMPNCYTPLEPSVTTMDINSVAQNTGTVYMGDPANGLTLNWKRHGDASQWQVYLDTIGAVTEADLDSMPESAFTTVTDTFYTVPAGTVLGGGKYKFWVRGDCGLVKSPWASYVFGAGAVKMNQSTTADTVTGCGFVVYDNGYDAGYLSPSNSALVLRPSTANNELQVFGGLFGFGATTTELTIYDGEGTAGTVLYTYNTLNTNNDRIDSVLATSTEGAMTIVFNATGGMAHTGFELYVRCVDGASCYRPDNVAVANYSHDGATITWDGGNAAEYHVYYRAEEATAWSMTSVSTSTATLTGLTPTTQYEAYVVGVCSSTDSSYASHHVTFTTACAPIVITESTPMLEDFEDATAPAECFTLVYGDGDATTNTMLHDASQHYSGSRSFRFSSVTASSDYSQYLVTPMISSDTVMRVTLWAKTAAATAPLRIGYSTTGNNVATDFAWNPAVSVSDSWSQLSATLPANTKYVAVNYAPTSSLYYLYIDSLYISVSSDAGCFAPSITNVSATHEAVSVSFSSEGATEVAINTGTNWNNNIQGTPVTGTTYTFTNLAPATTYTIGLRTDCGNGNYSAWATQVVTTTDAPCDVPTGLAYTDLGYTSATITWTAGNASQWQVRVSNGDNVDTIATQTNSVVLDRLDAGTTYNIMVRSVCSATNISDWSTTLTVTTPSCPVPTALAYSNVTLTSAVLDWDSDADSWELKVNDSILAVDAKPYTLTGLAAGTAYTVSVRTACNDTLRSAWSASVTFTTGACTAPTAVEATNVTATAATIGWTSSAAEWQIELNGTVSDVNDNPHTFTNLTPNTEYTVRVRAICGTDVTSDWSASATFTTGTTGIDDVDAASGVALYPNPATTAVTISLNGFEGTARVTIVDLNGRICGQWTTDQGKVDVDLSTFASGAYFVRVASENASAVRKLIVK